jgi:Plasmid pRiA4b ORF-3-like protein
VTYRVRVELLGCQPPVWRRLELASDLFLDDVHEILQVAFGWTDSHLHRFGCGPGYYSDDTEYYLMEYEVDEGETGIPEEQVRLDEVLVEVGDRLWYCYDFGDGWQHVVELEAVLPRPDSPGRAVCTDGRRPGAPEDCGGVHGYELIAAVSEPADSDSDALDAFAEFYGDLDPGAYTLTPLDFDEINRAMRDFDVELDVDKLAGPLADLLDAVRTAAGKRRLRRLIATALAAPVLVEVESAAAAVRPYLWLIDRVGAAGVTLTAAGYLPPIHVEAACTELDLRDAWIGKGNREDLTIPVLHLRESAQRMGLLRKHRGRLLATARGKAVCRDPIALWWHLAERMPPLSNDRCERQAGLLYLLAVAAEDADPDGVVIDLLGAIGWMTGDGAPLSRSTASRAAWDTKDVLQRLRMLDCGLRAMDRRERVTHGAVAFARAAVQSWPA